MNSVKIDDDLRQAIAQFLDSKFDNATNCLVCGAQGSCQLADHLVTPVATSPDGGMQMSANSYPQAMLICRNCGHTRYFNFIVMQGAGSNVG